MANITPPGYESFSEARRRAWDLWHSDSRGKLLGMLVAGKLTAWRADNAANVQPVEKEFWQTRDGAHLCEAASSEIHEMRDLPVFLTADLQRELPDIHERQERRAAEKQARRAQKKAGVPAAVAGNKGGHPVQLDWDGMWIEVVRIALFDDFPDRPADLRKKLVEWFNESGRQVPGDTIMKEKMRALYAVKNAAENEPQT